MHKTLFLPYLQRTISIISINASRLMFYREIIVVSYENYTKHINTLHSKIQSSLTLQNVVYLFTTKLQTYNPQ